MMRTNRAENLEKIKFFFCFCDTYISTSNEDGFTDVNNYIVDSLIPFLNSFLASNFIDLNKERINYPAIDLADKKNKKAIQVTTLDTINKKRITCELFIKNKLNLYYDELYIFHLKMKSNTTIPSTISEIYNNLSIFNLRDLFNHISSLEDIEIENLVTHINNNHKFTSTLHTSFNNINFDQKNIDIEKSKIKGFIYDSGIFLGGENDDEDATNIAKTYSDLINKISRLSLNAQKVLFYIVFNSRSFNDFGANNMLEANYINQNVLQNNFGESVLSYCDELIDAELMYHDEYNRSNLSSPAVYIYYRGLMIDGNAFNFLGHYLNYDVPKVRKVLLSGDISDLA